MKKSEKNERESAVMQPLPPARTFSETFHPRRRLTFSRHNGQDYVHIREFIQGDEREYPSKKGVSLTPGRFCALRAKINDIDEALQQQQETNNSQYTINLNTDLYRAHLGAGIFVTVNGKYQGVDFRRNWQPEGSVVPVATKVGIFVPTAQWVILKQKINELLSTFPELTLAEECFHQNQLGMVGCRECDPFGTWVRAMGD